MVLNEENMKVRGALRGMFHAVVSSFIIPIPFFVLIYLASPWPRDYVTLIAKVNYWIPSFYRGLLPFSVYVWLYSYYRSQPSNKPLYGTHLFIAEKMSLQSRLLLKTILSYWMLSLSVFAFIQGLVPVWKFSLRVIYLYYALWLILIVLWSILLSNFEHAGVMLSKYLEYGEYDDLYKGMIQVNTIARGMLSLEDLTQVINVIEATLLFDPNGLLRERMELLIEYLLSIDTQNVVVAIHDVLNASIEDDKYRHLARKPKLPWIYMIQNDLPGQLFNILKKNWLKIVGVLIIYFGLAQGLDETQISFLVELFKSLFL